jgi:hypothetical protein
MEKKIKTEKNSDDEEGWQDFVINTEDDIESPTKRPRRKMVSKMDIPEKFYSIDDNSDDSDDEDVSKSVKFITHAMKCIYNLVEENTKMFSYLLHTKLLLK